MSMNMSERKFHIKQGEETFVKIDGVDYSPMLQGIEVHMDGRQPAMLIMHAVPSLQAELEGAGFVYLQSRINDKVIDDLNPAEIEKLAMEREQWGSEKTLVENILDVIKEKLGAAH